MFFRPKTQVEKLEKPKSITSEILERIRITSNYISDKINNIVNPMLGGKGKKDTLSGLLFKDDLNNNPQVDIIKFDQKTGLPIYNKGFLEQLLGTKSDIKKEFGPDFTISGTPEVNSISINGVPLEDIKKGNIPNIGNTIEDTLNSLKKHEIYKTILDKSGIEELKINGNIYKKNELLFILDGTKKSIDNDILNRIEFIIGEIIGKDNVNLIKNNQIDGEFINNLGINKPNNFLKISNKESLEILSKTRSIKVNTRNKKNETSTNFIIYEQNGGYKIITNLNLFTITNGEDGFEILNNGSSINLNEGKGDGYVRFEANTKGLKIISNGLDIICNTIIGNEIDGKKIEIDKEPQDIYVLGDSNGSLELFKKNLISLGIINEKGEYKGGKKRTIILGDILCDRNTDGLEILKLIKKLNTQAKIYGGEFILISGNHEFEAVKLFLGDILKQPKQFLKESASRGIMEFFYYNGANKILKREDFIRMFGNNDKNLINNFLIDELTKRKELLSIKPESRKVLPTDNILIEIINNEGLESHKNITDEHIKNISYKKVEILIKLLNKSSNINSYKSGLNNFGSGILENMQKDEKGKIALETLSKSYLCRQIGGTLYTHTPLNNEMSKLISEYGIDNINEIFQKGLKNLLVSKDISIIKKIITDELNLKEIVDKNGIAYTLNFIRKKLIDKKIDNIDKIEDIIYLFGDFLIKIKDNGNINIDIDIDKLNFIKNLKIILLGSDFEKITQTFLNTNNKGEEISNESKKTLKSIGVTNIVHGHTKKTHPIEGIKSFSFDQKYGKVKANGKIEKK